MHREKSGHVISNYDVIWTKQKYIYMDKDTNHMPVFFKLGCDALKQNMTSTPNKNKQLMTPKTLNGHYLYSYFFNKGLHLLWK